MATPQPGIFAQGTRSHYHLEFDLRPRTRIPTVVAGRWRGCASRTVTAGRTQPRRRLRRRAVAGARTRGEPGRRSRRSRASRDRAARRRRPRTTSGCGSTAPVRTSCSTRPALVAAVLAPGRRPRGRAAVLRVPRQPRPDRLHRRHREPAGRGGARGRASSPTVTRGRAAATSSPSGGSTTSTPSTRLDGRGAGGHHRAHEAGQRRARDDQAADRPHQPGRHRGGRRGARDLPPQRALRDGRGARAVLRRLQRRSEPLRQDARPDVRHDGDGAPRPPDRLHARRSAARTTSPRRSKPSPPCTDFGWRAGARSRIHFPVAPSPRGAHGSGRIDITGIIGDGSNGHRSETPRLRPVGGARRSASAGEA